jgi:hypothetical protein
LTVHAKTAVSFIQSDYSNHLQTDCTFDLPIMVLRERMRVMPRAILLHNFFQTPNVIRRFQLPSRARPRKRNEIEKKVLSDDFPECDPNAGV